MKAKDYSVISNQWIEDKLKEALNVSVESKYNYGYISALRAMQQQLKPLESIVIDAFKAGYDYGNNESDVFEEEYLNKDVEL